VAAVHVVYAHPGGRGFTRQVLEAFLAGLDEAGHSRTVSDLYAMGFRAELSREEYEREAAYDAGAPVPADVAAEHERLDAADVWAFVYPVWWTDCPAILKGWFDRVWTVGFAYQAATPHTARRALVLCTSGYPVVELEASGCYQAMRTVMLTDRIAGRAEHSDFVVLGGSVLRKDEPAWERLRAEHLARAAALARSL
jgi:NAD(P)H dehydrogenase (quinone)